ncbi:uracil-DNA glycosylase [bacterium]|nr:uracil-DNA glycosylase [bacterium]
MKSRMAECSLCKLASQRNKIVFGAGDPSARIIFIGEAPGADEDRLGEPFVGRAGQLLDKIFAAMGLSRDKGIYIANILKCRPPRNRDPQPDEVEMCIPFLMEQLRIIRPKVICCLGRIAAQNLLKTDATLGRLRGRTHYFKIDEETEDIPMIVTYHPAYLLRNSAGKKPVWEDMKRLMEIAELDIPKK